MLEIFKVGDLVRLARTCDVGHGIVVKIFHEGSANEGLKVKMLNGDDRVCPSEDWEKT